MTHPVDIVRQAFANGAWGSVWDKMSHAERIAWLAGAVMGWYMEQSHYVPNVWNWECVGSIMCCAKDNRASVTNRSDIFDPIVNWNHFRKVEEKFIKLFHQRLYYINSFGTFADYLDAPLEVRAKNIFLSHHALCPDKQPVPPVT